MEDGANELVPGIAAITFGILFLEYGRPIEGALFFVCLIFLIFMWYRAGSFWVTPGATALAPRLFAMACRGWRRATFLQVLWRNSCHTPALIFW